MTSPLSLCWQTQHQPLAHLSLGLMFSTITAPCAWVRGCWHREEREHEIHLLSGKKGYLNPGTHEKVERLFHLLCSGMTAAWTLGKLELRQDRGAQLIAPAQVLAAPSSQSHILLGGVGFLFWNSCAYFHLELLISAPCNLQEKPPEVLLIQVEQNINLLWGIKHEAIQLKQVQKINFI